MSNDGMTIIGIDPGAKGAVSIIRGHTLLSCFDLLAADGRTDTAPLLEALQTLYVSEHKATTLVALEKPNPQPTFGAKTNHSMGRSIGAIEATVMCCGFRLEYATPSAWKKAMGLTANKADSLVMAERLWPNTGYFKRKKDDGRAESALIAEWYRTKKVGL